ncbi:MAG: HAMP domain-containing histidine kinase [Cyanobacteria bacterium SIG27]|nr:HAMP domain-containing histidine kinase [Cyanobacteria bacterium SIG27]
MFFKRKFFKKYREKLNKIKSKYEKSINIERNKFISILNHDIKTPILAQKQSLEFLLNSWFEDLSQEKRIIIEEIYNSNEFILEVLLNSIFLAKYEIENPKLNLEKINIIEQVQDCCEIIKQNAKQKQQKIIIKTNKIDDIKLNADRKLIQKIIYNILSSSVSSGFEESDIEILIKENKDFISFSAKNNSIFMTKEKLENLLKDKKDTKDFNQLGLNLNLNIAKKLINAHNWEIIANSNPDNSSEFGFLVKKN